MKRLMVLFSAPLLMGCATIARPITASAPDFSKVPEQVLREVAHEIERAVQDGDREAVFENREQLTIDTDEILQAIRTRIARSSLIDAFRDTGFVFEQRNGLIKIIRSAEYKKQGTSRDRDRNALLIIGENNDRWALYEGLVKLNDLPSGSLDGLRVIFAEARFRIMKPGQKIESPDGEIVPKAE